jgi:hypothetical protein
MISCKRIVCAITPIIPGSFMPIGDIASVSPGQGAILSAGGVSFGGEYSVANHGSNALLIYPPVGGTIGGGAVNAAYSLAAGKLGRFRNVALLTWTANP